MKLIGVPLVPVLLSENLHDNLLYALVAERARLRRSRSFVQYSALLAHASVQGVPVQEACNRVRVLADDAHAAVVIIILSTACAWGRADVTMAHSACCEFRLMK